MGVLARTDVQTFDRTTMYETKSYAQQGKRSDCRIHGGANKPLCGLGEHGLAMRSNRLLLFWWWQSRCHGSFYLKSSIKRLRGWACSHAQTYFLFCCRRRVSARDRLRDPYAVHGGGHDTARITGSLAAGVEAGGSCGLQGISAGNPDR